MSAPRALQSVEADSVRVLAVPGREAYLKAHPQARKAGASL